MDVRGRRNGAEKRKWTSGESQVNSYTMLASLFHISPLTEIPMFIIIYHTTHTVHVNTGAIRKLMCVFSHVRAIILSLRPVS